MTQFFFFKYQVYVNFFSNKHKKVFKATHFKHVGSEGKKTEWRSLLLGRKIKKNKVDYGV